MRGILGEAVKMDVLVVSQFFWPEPIGTPAYVTDLAKWFAARGETVTVLTGRPYYPEFRLWQGYESGQRDRETLDGVSIFRLPTIVPAKGHALRRILSEANFLLRAAIRLRTGKPGRGRHVISFSPSVLAVLAGALATRPGGRHLAVVHDIQSGLAAGLGMVRASALLRLMRAVESFALNRADRVVVLSENMKDVLRSQGVRRPIDVVPLWVDASIRPLPFSSGAPAMVLYSGNLGRKQGMDQVFSLAEILLAERPEVIVTIRGAGTAAADCRAQAEQRQLVNVRFEPLVPLDRLSEGLAEGDVHLVPQNPDAADFAVPSKVYNIMAAGRPFVATALPGSTLSVLGEESGGLLCVPPNDARAFADAVIGLIDDPSRRAEMGARGRRYVENTVARDVVLSRYAGLIAGSAEQ